MRAEATPIAEVGVSFTETQPGWWTVMIDGDESRTITRDETGFIAWIGTRDRHWCFDRALKACIDDARYQRSLRDEAARASAVAKARIEVLSDDQRMETIAAREAEMLGLRYAESHVDCVGRTAELRAEIEALGGRRE
jgi:hypothetical protein